MTTQSGEAAEPTRVVFIDSNTPDLPDLLAGLAPGETAYVLNPSSDGLQQIADILAANHLNGLSSISIVSHGASGELALGASPITGANLASHSDALAEIGSSLASDGNIQLYGCDVAAGPAGRQFIDDFSSLAGGAAVAAATHRVGGAAGGGGWALDAAAAAGAAAPAIPIAAPFTAQAQAAFQCELTITVANQPVVDLNGGGAGTSTTLGYTENQAATAIAPSGTVSDTDSANFNGGSLTVAFTANGAPEDQLTIQTDETVSVAGGVVSVGGNEIGTINATNNGANGTALEIDFDSANATPAAVSTLIECIAYSDNSDNPSALARSLSFTVNDGGGNANGRNPIGSATATINVTPVDDAPVLDLDADNSSSATGADFRTHYVPAGPGVSIADSDDSITDVDNTTLASATITLINPQADDLLSVSGVLPGNITASAYDPGTGVLTLTSAGATATLAQWQSALQQVVFSNPDSSPNTTERVLTVTVNDGTLDSNTAQTTITLTNSPPVVVPETVLFEAESGLLNGSAGIGGSGALAGDSDPDGNPLSITALAGGTVGAVKHGTFGDLTLNADGSYSYLVRATRDQQSALNAFSGAHPVDNFTFTVSDGQGGNTASTLAITLNREPGSNLQIATATVGTTLTVGAPGAVSGDPDQDGDTVSVIAVSGGAVGVATPETFGDLTLNADGSFTYVAAATPAEQSALAGVVGQHAQDNITSFTVGDGHGGSVPGQMFVTINRPPTVVTESAAAPVDIGIDRTAGTGGNGALAGDSDPDGGSLSITALAGGAVGGDTSGAFGDLTLNADGSYDYFAGNDAAIAAAPVGSHPHDVFTYTVSDPDDSASATLDFSIDRAPVTVAESATAPAGATITATAGIGGTGALAADSDPDGDALSIVRSPSNNGVFGALTLNGDGSYSYTANNAAAIAAAPTGSHPQDSFTFAVGDGQGGETDATLDIAIDRAPVVVGKEARVLAGTTITATAGTGGTGALGGDSDPDGDALSITALAGGRVGVVDHGTFGNLILNADGSYSYAAGSTGAQRSALAGVSGTHAADVFSFTVTDVLGDDVPGIDLAVLVDRPPVALNETGSVVAGATLDGSAGTSGTGALAGDTDPDGDSLSITALSGGAVGNQLNFGTFGALTLNADGAYSYRATNVAALAAAPTGSHPHDIFTFTVGDGLVGTGATLDITLDRAPSVVTETASVLPGATVGGSAGIGGSGALAGDSDPDGDTISITALSGGTLGQVDHGTFGDLTLNADGSYSYVANNTAAIAAAPTGSHPHDSFTYTVSDGLGGSTQATLNVAPDRAPATVAESATGAAGTTITGTAGIGGTGALAGDSDPDGDTLSVTALAGGTVGVADSGTFGNLTLNADGSYSYVTGATTAERSALTGLAGGPGAESFTYTVSDGQGGNTSATLTLNIARDQPPVITTLVGQPTDGSTIEVQGTGQSGDTVALFADGGTSPVGTGTISANGSFDIITTTKFTDGLHTLTAAETNPVDLASAVSSGFAVLVVPPPTSTPRGTSAEIILRAHEPGNINGQSHAGNDFYQILDIGNNAILGSGGLGEAGLENQVAGFGDFSGNPGEADMMLRNTNTGAFAVDDIQNNQAVSAFSLGAVGLENQVAGFGDFSGSPGETDMMMRNTNTGAFAIYDIQHNQAVSASSLGAVGLENQVAGFGDFSGNPNETDMMLRNTNTGSFAIYDIQHNQAVSAFLLPDAVGLENQVVGFGDFSGNPGETDMMLRNTNTGAFEVNDIQHNQAVSAFSLGAVGLENQVAGFGDFSGNPNETDMLLRNTNTGTFEVYDIQHNQAVSASLLSGVGLEWQVQGVANLPLGV